MVKAIEMIDRPEVTSVREIVEETGVSGELAAISVPKQPSKAAIKLVKMAEEIKGQKAVQIAYMARFLIQCTLPHSDPGDVPVWRRKNGDYTLRIQPGLDNKDRPMGYPYGTIPRILLVWLITEAKRTKIRKIELGESFGEFMDSLNLNKSNGTGKRSDAKRLKEQARKLFSSRIEYIRTTAYKDLRTGRDMIGEENTEHRLASQRFLCWEVEDKKLGWDSWIVLSHEFFAAIMEATPPCDLMAIRMLQRSPMALDLYMLLNWLAATRKKHTLTWTMLGQQLGCDYTDRKNMKKKMVAALAKVRLAHPKLKVHMMPQGGGFIVYASEPAVPRR